MWFSFSWIDYARECVCEQDVFAKSKEEAIKLFNSFYRFPPKNVRISVKN